MKLSNCKYIIAWFMISLSFVVYANDNIDIIVTNDGESLKVFNLDYSPTDFCYYTLEPNSNDLKRIKKSDILIIKLSNGTKVDFNDINIGSSTKLDNKSTNPAAHTPISVDAIENDFIEVVSQKGKKGKPDIVDKYILIKDSNGQILNLRLLPDREKELAVAKLRNDQKFEKSEIVIPEYVYVNGIQYSITQIDDEAFNCKGKGDVTNIVFPETLKDIGASAFYRLRHLKRIVLPESLEKIGYGAFSECGNACQTFEQLYIPKSVKEIGKNAFWYVGPNTSWRAFFQGNLTSIPNFISVGNCTAIGIDEEAVEAYEKRYTTNNNQ